MVDDLGIGPASILVDELAQISFFVMKMGGQRLQCQICIMRFHIAEDVRHGHSSRRGVTVGIVVVGGLIAPDDIGKENVQEIYGHIVGELVRAGKFLKKMLIDLPDLTAGRHHKKHVVLFRPEQRVPEKVREKIIALKQLQKCGFKQIPVDHDAQHDVLLPDGVSAAHLG